MRIIKQIRSHAICAWIPQVRVLVAAELRAQKTPVCILFVTLAILIAASLLWSWTEQREHHTQSHVPPESIGKSVVGESHRFALFARGAEDELSGTYDLGAANSPIRALSTADTVNPLSALMTVKDPSDVIRVVFALLAMLIGFSSMVRERQCGTLKLLVSNGVSPRVFVASKWLGNVCLIGVPIVALAIVGVLVRPDNGARDKEELVALLLILGCIWLYGGIFIALGLWAGAASLTVKKSLIVAIQTWLLLTIIIPQLSWGLATWIRPPITRLGVDIRAARIRIANIQAANDEVRKATNGSGFAATAIYARYEGDTARYIDQAEITYATRLARTIDIARWFARLSPSSCVTFAQTALVGTGVDAALQFRMQLLTLKRRTVAITLSNRNLPKARWHPAPAPTSIIVPFDRFLGAGFDMVMLVAYLGLAAILACRSIARLDLR